MYHTVLQYNGKNEYDKVLKYYNAAYMERDDQKLGMKVSERII